MIGDYEKFNKTDICTYPTKHDHRRSKNIAKSLSDLYPREVEKGLTHLRKLIALRDKYPYEPELRETTIEHDTWGNMTLRYTEDAHKYTT